MTYLLNSIKAVLTNYNNIAWREDITEAPNGCSILNIIMVMITRHVDHNPFYKRKEGWEDDLENLRALKKLARANKEALDQIGQWWWEEQLWRKTFEF